MLNNGGVIAITNFGSTHWRVFMIVAHMIINEVNGHVGMDQLDARRTKPYLCFLAEDLEMKRDNRTIVYIDFIQAELIEARPEIHCFRLTDRGWKVYTDLLKGQAAGCWQTKLSYRYVEDHLLTLEKEMLTRWSQWQEAIGDGKPGTIQQQKQTDFYVARIAYTERLIKVKMGLWPIAGAKK